jgi:hypothetical protein
MVSIQDLIADNKFLGNRIKGKSCRATRSVIELTLREENASAYLGVTKVELRAITIT